jgi:hypothetical protein
LKRLAIVLLGGLLVLSSCSSPNGSGGGGGGSPSVAFKLSVIDVGNGSEEAEFQGVIDCIMSSGIKGAETETKVGDVLYASWKQSSQKESLLEWGRVLCSG